MSAQTFRVWATVIAVVGIITAAGALGYFAGKTSVTAKWRASDAIAAQRLAEIERKHRQTERTWQTKNQALTDELHDNLAATAASESALVADLRADNLRLRQRFQGCAARVPDAAHAAGGDDDSSESGLSHADEEFLIRVAAQADQAAHRLAACQEYVRNIQKP